MAIKRVRGGGVVETAAGIAGGACLCSLAKCFDVYSVLNAISHCGVKSREWSCAASCFFVAGVEVFHLPAFLIIILAMGEGGGRREVRALNAVLVEVCGCLMIGVGSRRRRSKKRNSLSLLQGGGGCFPRSIASPRAPSLLPLKKFAPFSPARAHFQTPTHDAYAEVETYLSGRCHVGGARDSGSR